MLSYNTPLAELRALFRKSPAFRQVLIADVITQLGDGGMLIAFPLLILERTHDVTLTGVAFSGEFLAFGLLSPLAGYLADRLDQKRLMIGADTARAAILGLMLLALAQHWPVAVFMGLSVLLGGTGAFFMPARAALLRRLLDGPDLERVIALEGTISFLLRLISPPLMGLLLAVYPAALGIQLGVLAYLVGAFLLVPSWVRGRHIEPEEGESDDWREGFRFIRGHLELRGLLAMDVAVCAVGTAAFSTTVALLEQGLHLPAQANAWLLATTGLAGAVGTQLAGRLGQGRAVYAGMTGAIAATYLLVPHAGSLPMLVAMWALRGLAIGAFCVLLNQRIAQVVPATVMGRVQSAWGLAACAAAFVGSGSTPWLMRGMGAPHSFTLFGALLTLVALVLAAPLLVRRPVLAEAN
ncbi:MAG: major facilitator superfamily 1 [Cyanobacteria bacterium RYN_339]|nr:major facilitator superfamily 1 [Cyanobacteria bacterium RYN_339]